MSDRQLLALIAMGVMFAALVGVILAKIIFQ